MRILNQPQKPENVEIHVALSRREIEYIIEDIENDTANDKSASYAVTDDFMAYLRSL